MLLVASAVPSDAALWAILVLSFGTGLLHALDADHVMAVSALATRGSSWRKVLRVSSAWALGHGLMLVAVGAAVYLAGLSIPEDLAAVAERSVGLMLVAVGASVLVQLGRRRAHLHAHRHDDLGIHVHLHTHDEPGHDHRHEHRAVMVGLVHGLAGSAPLLALIPLSQVGSPAVAMVYLVVFGLGVLVAMAVVGGVFGGLLRWGSRLGGAMASGLRGLTGTLSVLFGVWLISGG